jgi:hypothetical protein
MLGDGFLDFLLSWIRAGIPVVYRESDILERAGILGDRIAVDAAGYVHAALADKDANPLRQGFLTPFL